jgi:hypothetical protein
MAVIRGIRTYDAFVVLAAWSHATEVPWWVAWIPLFAAVIGLLGGLAGVLIGAWLRDRGEARRWRLQKRSDALLVFAERADAYLITLTRYVAPAVAGQVTANDVLEAMFALSGAGTIVQMMSPKAIRAVVESLMSYVTNDIMPFTLPGTPAVGQVQAQNMLNAFVARLATFVDVARADFGEGREKNSKTKQQPLQAPQPPQQQG